MALSRTDLQSLAELKLSDSKLLLDNSSYSNAYYLAGYAIELGLKACVARQIRQDEIPDKELITRVYTHNFENLAGLAGLKADLKVRQDDDHKFQAYWGIVAEWSPDARYAIQDSLSAQLLWQAISDPDHGVLKWIKIHW
jgi:HEPN domain-containing protein